MTKRALLLLFLPLLAFTSRLSAQTPASYELTVDYAIMGYGSTATCGSLCEVYAIMNNGGYTLISSGSLDGLQPGEMRQFPPTTITFTSDNPVVGIATWSVRKISCSQTAAKYETDYLFPQGDRTWLDINIHGLFAGYVVQSNLHATINPVINTYELQIPRTEGYPAIPSTMKTTVANR